MNDPGILAQGPFDNVDNWFQILVFVVIFGGWILKAVIQTFAKAAKQAPKKQPGAPAKGLRDFLQEIRQEAERVSNQQRGVKPEPKRIPDEELEWEVVEDFDPDGQAAGREAAARQRENRAEERRAEPMRLGDERLRAREVRGRQTRKPSQQEAAEAQSLPQEPQQRSLAERHLESSLADRHVKSTVADRELQSALATRKLGGLRTRLAGPKRRRRERQQPLQHLVGALDGMTVKDLLLAQVVLGKPRSLKRSHRD